MKKVALINPGRKEGFAENEPLNLGFLAAYLEKNGHSVKIIDQLSGENVEEKLRNFKPDVIGVTATTPVIEDAYRILELARKQNAVTVIGGGHASVMPQEAKKYADFVVVGEGEKALLDIVEGREKPGIIRGCFIENIDEIPSPSRDLMNTDFYYGRKKEIRTAHLFFLPAGKKLATMITSRGCPYSCIFCHNSWKGIPVRYNSAARVIEEIIGLKEKYGIEAIFFMDDDFFVNSRRLKEICNLILEKQIDMIWSANARVSSVNPEILETAKRSGLRQVNFGIESGSQRILDVLEKRTTVQQSEYAVKTAKDAGVLVYATYMIGNPTETLKDIEETEKFILKNKVDSIGIGITTPYPGTKLWDWCKERHFIPEKIRWEDFDMENCIIPANESISRDQIEKIRSRIVIKVMLANRFKMFLFYLKLIVLNPAEFFYKLSRLLLPLLKIRNNHRV